MVMEMTMKTIDTYTEFTKDIDTVLMGWNTSHQVVTELSSARMGI